MEKGFALHMKKKLKANGRFVPILVAFDLVALKKKLKN